MPSLAKARKLLTSSTRVATLVCVGVAETACNLVVQPYDAGARPSDAGTETDGAMDAAIDAAPLDAAIETDGATESDGAAVGDGGSPAEPPDGSTPVDDSGAAPAP